MTLPNPQPSDYKLLLEVFRAGLIQGIIAKQQIVAWADEIITQTPEPDYFFIELSLGQNQPINYIIEVIGQIPDVQPSAVSSRVLLGLLYHQLNIGKIDIPKAILGFNSFNNRNTLTIFELGWIYQLEDDYDISWGENESAEWERLTNDTLTFLTYYKNFELSNYEKWPEINQQIVEIIAIETAKHKEMNDAYMQRYNKKQAAAKQKLFLREMLFYVIAVIPFLLVFSLAVKFRKYIFRDDLMMTVVSVLLLILFTTFRIITTRADR